MEGYLTVAKAHEVFAVICEAVKCEMGFLRRGLFWAELCSLLRKKRHKKSLHVLNTLPTLLIPLLLFFVGNKHFVFMTWNQSRNEKISLSSFSRGGKLKHETSHENLPK